MTFSPFRCLALLACFLTLVLGGSANALLLNVPNASFELPVLNNGEINFNDAPGWSSVAPEGSGTENHSNGVFAGAQASDGQNVYWNNIGSDPSATGNLLSDVIGALTPGTYTLSADFLFRTDSISTDSMPNTSFGLSIDGQNILGTPISVTDALDAGGAGLISTQVYSLTIGASDANLGADYSILFNASHNGSSSYNQLALDNIRLDAPSTDPQVIFNYQTGAVTLTKAGGSDVRITGYSLQSEIGAFDQSQWNPISGTRDATPGQGGTTGNGTVDSNDVWTVLSSPSSTGDISEFSFDTTPGDGAILSASSQIQLGTPWIPTPLTDFLTAEIALQDGSLVDAVVTFEGTAPLVGDLNRDGQLTVADWQTYVANASASLTGLSPVEAYLAGDLNGDGVNNLEDTDLFITTFESFNGAGSFAAAIQAVPEPSTAPAIFLLLSLVGGWRFLRPRALKLNIAMLVTFTGAIAPVAFAIDIPITNGSFENPVLNNGQINNGPVPGWSAGGTENHNRETIFGGQSASDGVSVFWSNLGFDTSATFSVLSNVVTQLDAGAYTLSIDFLFRTDSISTDSQPNTLFGLTTDGTNFLGTPTSVTDALDAGGAGLISTQTYNFTVNPGDALIGNDFQILVSATHNQAGTWNQLAFDNVRLDTTGAFVPDTLGLEVNTLTGLVRLRNDTLGPVSIKGYEIGSGSGLLDREAWLSLDEQNLDPVGGGQGPGETWDEIGSSSANQLQEGFLLGSTSIPSGQSLNLGVAFDELISGVGVDGDLTFRYRTAAGELEEGFVTYIQDASVLPGDFNGDGQVNLADYTVWRDNLGGTEAALAGNATGDNVVNGSDYLLWKSNFGSAAAASSVAAASVPEPSSALLLVLLGLPLLRRKWPVRCSPGLAFAMLAALWALMPGTTFADVFNDRFYRFGEDADEGATAAGLVLGSASGNAAPGFTLDTAQPSDPSGTRLLLSVAGNPQYVDVATLGTGRTGLGAQFDGDGDYLVGLPLNLPAELGELVQQAFGAPYPLEYAGLFGRGLQGYVYPDAAALGSTATPTNFQSVVFDTIFAGGPAINATGQWSQSFANRTATPATVPVAAGNQWYHVMQHIYAFEEDGPSVDPLTGADAGWTSILYVDGVAVSALNDVVQTAGSNPDRVGDLVVGGSETANNGEIATYGNFFTGAIDELEMYVYGDNSAVPGGQDYGTFDLFADNEWIANAIADLPGGILRPGDVNRDGSINSLDVDQFVDGWLSEKTFTDSNGKVVRAGDWLTWEQGDFNHDGITDLSDAIVLHQALLGAGAGGLDFARLQGVAVPEPSTLGGVALLLIVAGIRRRCRVG